jgi:hypothetical protein
MCPRPRQRDDRHHLDLLRRERKGVMELIGTVLVAVPIGYFIRNRLAAFVTYIAVHGIIFTFQTMELVREWVGGSTDAFPKDPATTPWAYLVVNAVIFAAGLGLVWLGNRLGNRRRTGTAQPVDLAA